MGSAPTSDVRETRCSLALRGTNMNPTESLLILAELARRRMREAKLEAALLEMYEASADPTDRVRVKDVHEEVAQTLELYVEEPDLRATLTRIVHRLGCRTSFVRGKRHFIGLKRSAVHPRHGQPCCEHCRVPAALRKPRFRPWEKK